MPTHILPRLAAALLLVLLASCAGPPIKLGGWRERQTEALQLAALPDAEVGPRLEQVETLRNRMELAEARKLALRLVADYPTDPRALSAASRAESDAVFLFEEQDKHARNHAAASALDYARRASELGAYSAADRAQLAWALGNSTHLQSTRRRADHAQHTKAAAQSALSLDPSEPTALATLALLYLRLETLPWIARLMATGLPESSLDDAKRCAMAACESLPNRENRLILAKVFKAEKNRAAARATIDTALSAPPQHPRDLVLARELEKLRASVD